LDHILISGEGGFGAKDSGNEDCSGDETKRPASGYGVDAVFELIRHGRMRSAFYLRVSPRVELCAGAEREWNFQTSGQI
jgi:hypothetical protein